eukprot:376693-Amphidinium_carterae.1
MEETLGAIPPELQGLSLREEQLLAKVQLTECLYHMPRSGACGLRGRVFVAPLETPQVVDVLRELKVVEEQRRITFTTTAEVDTVRPPKVGEVLRHVEALIAAKQPAD